MGNAIVGIIIGGVTKRQIPVNGDVRLVDNITVFISAEELLEWIRAEVAPDVIFAA